MHWEPGGYNVARNRKDAIALTRDAAASDRWVIEGIYGWLAREAHEVIFYDFSGAKTCLRHTSEVTAFANFTRLRSS